MGALANVARLCMACALTVSARPSASRSADSTRYTLEQVLEQASKNAREIEIIRAEIAAGKQEIRFYRAEVYPTISVRNGAGYAWISTRGISRFGGAPEESGEGALRKSTAPAQTPDSDTGFFAAAPDRIDGTTLSWSIGIDQPLITFGRIAGALKLAGLREEVLQYRERLRLDRFYFSVIEQFGTVYRRQHMVAIARRRARTASRLLQFIRVERAGGAASAIDSLRTQARVAEATADLLQARGNLAIARRELSSTAELPRDTGYHQIGRAHV